jgi:hypothetical protein
MYTTHRPSRAPDRFPNHFSRHHGPPQLPRLDYDTSRYGLPSPHNSQTNSYIPRSPTQSSYATYGHSDPYQPLSGNNSQFSDGSINEYDHRKATRPESRSVAPNGVPRLPTTRTQHITNVDHRAIYPDSTHPIRPNLASGTTYVPTNGACRLLVDLTSYFMSPKTYHCFSGVPLR